MTEEGKRIWIFPDGELPEKTEGSPLEAHEALMILNTSDTVSHVSLSFYFADRPPIKNVSVSVESERVKCIRMDHPNEIGGVRLPFHTQYALRVESDVRVIATFGRLDTTSERMAFYTSAWYTE